jgi:predicted nicotinamide N-methyase
MRSPEQRDTPDIIAGRRVRRVDIDVGDLRLFVLEAADADAVLEETVSDDGDPYAAILWPSSIAAAGLLARIAAPGQRVVDAGAGTGLVALVAARLGCRATALDHDPFARAVIACSARLQRLRVQVADFDLTAPDPLPAADILVIADLLYESDLARTIASRVREALRSGSRVIVGDPARYGRTTFERELHSLGVSISFDDILVRVPGDPQPTRVGLALIEP